MKKILISATAVLLLCATTACSPFSNNEDGVEVVPKKTATPNASTPGNSASPKPSGSTTTPGGSEQVPDALGAILADLAQQIFTKADAAARAAGLTTPTQEMLVKAAGAVPSGTVTVTVVSGTAMEMESTTHPGDLRCVWMISSGFNINVGSCAENEQ